MKPLPASAPARRSLSGNGGKGFALLLQAILLQRKMDFVRDKWSERLRLKSEIMCVPPLTSLPVHPATATSSAMTTSSPQAGPPGRAQLLLSSKPKAIFTIFQFLGHKKGRDLKDTRKGGRWPEAGRCPALTRRIGRLPLWEVSMLQGAQSGLEAGLPPMPPEGALKRHRDPQGYVHGAVSQPLRRPVAPKQGSRISVWPEPTTSASKVRESDTMVMTPCHQFAWFAHWWLYLQP